MKSRIASRTSTIDTEKCVQQSGGMRYDLILVAAQRLRELKRQHRTDNKYVTCIDALTEIQNGHINMADYLVKIK